MERPFGYPSDRFRWYVRLPLVGGGCILLGLLATAAALEPSSRGFGTHQQLGLAQCSMLSFTGGRLRCPSCGMTTSWAHMMRGQVLGALRANVGGALLAAAAMISGPWLLISGLRGRWLLGCPNEFVVAAIGVSIVLITVVDWVLRSFVFA